MRTYQEIDTLFKETRKPPRSKKYNENQRPLRRVTENHLMLEKDDAKYHVKINGTSIAVFHPTNSVDEWAVDLKGLYSTYDIHLMRQLTGFHNHQLFVTSLNQEVIVPLNPFYYAQGKPCSASLVFDRNNKLVVEKSWHADVYSRRASEDDKAKRKEIKDRLDAYVTLQMFKLPMLIQNAKVSASLGQPFAEFPKQGTQQVVAMGIYSTNIDNAEFMQAFDTMAQSTFDMLASKKVYNDNSMGSLFGLAQGWGSRSNPALISDAKEKIQDIVNSITPDELKTSLVNRILTLSGISKGSDFVPLGTFPNKLPNRYYWQSKD